MTADTETAKAKVGMVRKNCEKCGATHWKFPDDSNICYHCRPMKKKGHGGHEVEAL